MRITCEPLCKTVPVVGLASMPCFHCGDGLPDGVFPNTPPSARSLGSNGYILTGTGISPKWAELARNADLELFLIPMKAGAAVLGPSVDGVYAVTLATGEQLSFAFGVTSLSAARITAGYNVGITITAGGGSAHADLVDAMGNPSTYGWNIVGASQITDSAGNAMTVQNAERIAFLVAGGLLPNAALTTGAVVITLTATPIGGGTPLVAEVTINQTVA